MTLLDLQHGGGHFGSLWKPELLSCSQLGCRNRKEMQQIWKTCWHEINKYVRMYLTYFWGLSYEFVYIIYEKNTPPEIRYCIWLCGLFVLNLMLCYTWRQVTPGTVVSIYLVHWWPPNIWKHHNLQRIWYKVIYSLMDIIYLRHSESMCVSFRNKLEISQDMTLW